jgi:D-glycero-alpha-D-manno-heptose-7-phosphate kinase
VIDPHHFQYEFRKDAPYSLVTVRTPMRVSFLGGGTDYPDYYLREGGQVLATSIDKYAYFTLNRLGELVQEKYRLHYSRYEAVNGVEEIQHPGIRGCFRYLKIDGGLNLSYTADLPAKTGLGASSCFTVGLLHALHAFYRRLIGQEELAMLAIHVEQEVLRESVGSQDQYMCAMGGLRHVKFEPSGCVWSELIRLPAERASALESRLMMFFTNVTRFASAVLLEQVDQTRQKALDPALRDLAALVEEGKKVLVGSGSLDEFGRVLDRSWRIKKGLSSRVSNPLIDEMYDAARSAGALGGKLLGAGGGGFLLLYVPPERQEAVRSVLRSHPEIAFSFDVTGSQLLYVH